MPGWFIHLDVAKNVADILAAIGEPRTIAVGALPISSFESDGWTSEELSAIIQKYPNYYALGAIGPDIFFLLPDFKGRSGNYIAKLAEWVIKYYDLLDEQVFKPWEDIMGPIEENTAEELSRLTGDLNHEIGNVMKYASGIVTEAILDFASRLYDFSGYSGRVCHRGTMTAFSSGRTCFIGGWASIWPGFPQMLWRNSSQHVTSSNDRPIRCQCRLSRERLNLLQMRHTWSACNRRMKISSSVGTRSSCYHSSGD